MNKNKSPLTLEEVEKNPWVREFIYRSQETLARLGYTDHGFRHTKLVAERARFLAEKIGLSMREQELCAIAGYCHDFANFLSREYHPYLGSLLIFEIFKHRLDYKEMGLLMKAISFHEKENMDYLQTQKEGVQFSDPVSAVVVLADKSDVRRDRVLAKQMRLIKRDIHNRVNYAVRHTNLEVRKKEKAIRLSLEIDTNFVPVMEYFEIFTERMVYCRKAAEYLGYRFELIINKFKLL